MANVTTTTQVAGPVNVIFQQTLLRNAKPLCPYLVGAQEGDVIQSHSGSFTIKWRRIDNLTPTTSALSELTGALSLPARSPGSILAVTDTTAVLLKFGDFIVMTEETDLINFNGQTDKVMEVLGIQSGRSLNRLQRNELEDNGTIVRPNQVATDAEIGDRITVDLLRYAINQLDRNDAYKFTEMSTGSQNVGTSPMLPAYFLLCHSDVAADISLLNGFKSVETYAGQLATKPGEFGAITLAGSAVRCIATSEGTIDAGTGADGSAGVRITTAKVDVYSTVIMGQYYHGAASLDVNLIKEIYRAGDELPGIQVITHGRGTSGIADALNDLGSMGWKFWHVPKILNSVWGLTIRSAASKLAA